MASAAFLGSPVGPVVAAEEVAVVEGLFKGYNGKQAMKHWWPTLRRIL